MSKKTNAKPISELRAKAENELHARQLPSPSMPTARIESLVHELQVHQIELEMQNEELRRTQIEVETSRDSYLELYDFAPVGYLTLDGAGIVLAANLTASEMLRIDRSKLVRQNFAHLVVYRDAEILRQHLAEVFSTTGRWGCEIELAVCKEDQPLYVRLESILAQRQREEGPACRTALIDITKRKLVEEQLRHSQKMEALGQLAAGVAHEFNNALAVIVGNTDILKQIIERSPETMGEALECTTRMHSAADRAANVARQLLSYGRKQMARPTVVDLSQIISDAMKMYSHLLGEAIELRTALKSNPRLVWMDADQMRQVLLNLLLNARDAMPGGGVLIVETTDVDLDEHYASVHLGTKAGPHVRMRIIDTGTGMDADTQRRVFEPFFSTKPVGAGSGLGLAVVDGIIAQAGGHITIDSVLGQGTTVTAMLPAAAAAAPIHHHEERPQRPVSGKGTILVCEDEDLVRDSLRRLLATSGFTVIEARSGVQALAKAEEYDGQIDLLLTDVVMQGMCGPELAKKMIAKSPGLRVLFMTGYGPEVLESDSGIGDWSDLLLKPYRHDALVEKISELLNRV